MIDHSVASSQADDLSSSAPAARTGTGRRISKSEAVLWTLPGFCDRVRITTSFGDLPVQALRKRDPLRTSDNRIAAVGWVDRIQLDEDFLGANPDALPVRIPANAFGPGRPMQELLISPHQQVNVSTVPFGQDFRLARDLLDRPGVMRQPQVLVSYFVFHCGTPVSVLAEGVSVRVTP